MTNPLGQPRRERWTSVLPLALAFVAWMGAVAGTSAFQIVKVQALSDLMGSAEYRMSGPVLEGRIQAAYFVVWALSSVLFGRVADQRGRVYALRIATLMVAAGSVSSALAGTTGQMIASRLVVALGGGGVWGAAMSLVVENVRQKLPLNPNGLVQTAVSIGHLAVAAANLLLASAPWRWLFALTACLSVAAFALALVLPCDGAPTAERPLGDARSSSARRPSMRAVIVGLALGFAGIAGSVHVGFWVPNLASDVVGTGSGVDVRRLVSMTVFLAQGGAIIGILAASWLADRASRKGAFLLFTIGAATAIGLLPATVADRPTLLVASLLLGFFATGWTGLLAVYLPELYAREQRATFAGAAYNLGRLATAAQLAIVGGIVTTQGTRAGLAWGAIVYAVALVALLWTPETGKRSVRALSS